jgi:hydroxymethylcytosylglucuronate/cytosylglucuronate synthase
VPIQPSFTLLAAARHIGWGGVGKLRLILERLPHAQIMLHGDEHSIAITREFLGSRHKFVEHAPQRIDVALVINDFTASNSIAARNVPIVYVDSIPYVRKTDADIPSLTKVAYYCAQKYPLESLPLPSALLRKSHDIKWIDPIVPVPQSRRGGRGIVVNLGGLYTYNVGGITNDLADKAVDAYLGLVLFPLVSLLQASGRKIFAICGNLNAETCSRLRIMLPQCDAIGPQSPYAFERILTDADLLITSPGSTTILQAMSINLPTLFLPSQNSSQHFNARLYSKPGTDIMRWPASVLDEAKREKALSEGLTAVLTYIYSSIISAANSNTIADEVATVIREAVVKAPADGILNHFLPELGFEGANQVAKLVTQVALRGQ